MYRNATCNELSTEHVEKLFIPEWFKKRNDNHCSELDLHALIKFDWFLKWRYYAIVNFWLKREMCSRCGIFINNVGELFCQSKLLALFTFT